MAVCLSQSENVNVLLNTANWAWPQAVSQIFQPRGINALVAESSGDMVNLVDKNKIHLAILDTSLDDLSGLRTLELIRNHDNLLPCLLLANTIDKRLLAGALKLKVFSVLTKPVNLGQLANQINRIFQKYYSSNLFSNNLTFSNDSSNRRIIIKRKSILRWSIKKK